MPRRRDGGEVRRLAEIGERIRQVREEKSMSQLRLGAEANVTKSAIRNYERGEKQMSMLVFIAIARSLNVSMRWLADGPNGH